MPTMAGKAPTAGIVLAAGTSTRFGTFKLLQPLGERVLLEWVLDTCLHSKLERIFLVLGYKRAEIMDALAETKKHPRLCIVFNQDYLRGQSTSLRAGLNATKGQFPSVMFILGDQPLIDAKNLDMLLERFWHSDKNICVPFHNNRRGNPVIFSEKFYPQIENICGDLGAREIIDNNAEDVLRIDLSEPSFFHDVDTREDIKQVSAYIDIEAKAK